MELDSTKGILHIATGDYEIVKDLVSLFNEVYKESIVYKDSKDIDGVMFSYIDVSMLSIDKIFLFGSMFGSKIRELRDDKNIDW
ncbi:hypothetical protein HME9304_01283 [Flagellimonas maritima]|uniref:Uncharacterized protein n=1 Tax=Flagellimonas maritima TaxID=1383885 RepID=A0A2Z4LR45_9FLAO|nr:hypothetical protein [Allomuricauda aurantiaca]AWX44283.1 hypothetical protein HME9304_01283 [Allomuricauda aurantiaca]